MSDAALGDAPAPPAPTPPVLVPLLYRVVSRRHETADVTTLRLAPVKERVAPGRPGQFNMLSAFGVGEAAISLSATDDGSGALQHTIRDVGAVSHALCTSAPGDLVGVRGPFGTGWGVSELGYGDVVAVAGGIGLAPLAGAIDVLAERRRYGGGRVFVAVGARNPDQVMLRSELGRWLHAGARVRVTVDAAPAGFTGGVGLVTQLLPGLGFDPKRTTALVCGPEVMIRFTAHALLDLGVPPGAIRVSLERNMQCGTALCGHCQLGPLLLCRDGPVVTWNDELADLLAERER